MIRIAMLSYWHLHAADYTHDALAHPDTEITAVWDEDPVRGAAEAAALGVPFVPGLGDVLAREDVDAVVVSTPTSMHRDVTVAAARAGKHVFTEKVMAATVDEADEIVAAAQDADIVFMVSMRRDEDASTGVIADLLGSGAIGQVTGLRVRDGHPFALASEGKPDGILPPQFWDPATAQGGILIDLCHPIYLAARLLGSPVDVSAVLTHVTGRVLEDNAVVTLRYADGAIAVAETSSVSAITPFLIEAHGTEGSLTYAEDGIGEMVAHRRAGVTFPSDDPSGPSGSVLLRSAAGPLGWQRIEVPAGTDSGAFGKWVQHIQDGTRADANIALARTLSAIVEAAYTSDAEDGRRIRIS